MKRIVLSLVAAAGFVWPFVGFAVDGDFIDPATLHDTISISVGREFAIAFDERGDRLTNPCRVEGAQARPTVTLKFFVPPDHKDLFVLIVNTSYRPRRGIAARRG